MRVLIVGAGAIGQVFARHFALGGADVSFLVRPRYAEDARKGFAMYPQNRGALERDVPVRLEGFGVYDDQAAAMQESWDLVVLAVSSIALKKGEWIAELGQTLGDGCLLTLQAGPDDPAFVLKRVPEDRVAFGMLSVISFQAPLPGDTLPEPGVAYWFPPMSKLGFSGSPKALERIVGPLSDGGMPVKTVGHVATEVAFAGAILSQVIHALECAEWSFADLGRDPELLPLARQAMGELWALAEREHGVKTPLGMRMIRPFMLRLILWSSRYLLSFDLERFFDFHYHKVAEQTRTMLETQIGHCRDKGLPTTALEELGRRMDLQRAKEAAAAGAAA